MSIEIAAHHMSFPVHDLERSRAFYEGVLNLRQIERSNFGFPGAWYQAGPCQIHLIEAPEGAPVGAPPPTLNPMARHAAFEVSDYAATLTHLQSHGVTVLDTSPEQGQMWVRDPDGHVLEFIVTRK